MRNRNVRRLAGLVLLTGAIVSLLSSAMASPPAKERYMITAPHTEAECVKALEEASKVEGKFLEKCDWGCMAGDHTCYVILEGKDEASVKEMLPTSFADAKVVRLNKFTRDQIASFHKK